MLGSKLKQGHYYYDSIYGAWFKVLAEHHPNDTQVYHVKYSPDRVNTYADYLPREDNKKYFPSAVVVNAQEISILEGMIHVGE